MAVVLVMELTMVRGGGLLPAGMPETQRYKINQIIYLTHINQIITCTFIIQIQNIISDNS